MMIAPYLCMLTPPPELSDPPARIHKEGTISVFPSPPEDYSPFCYIYIYIFVTST